jgi:hypothetical protein
LRLSSCHAPSHVPSSFALFSDRTTAITESRESIVHFKVARLRDAA